MYQSLKKLYSEFSQQEKRRLLLLSILIIITALVQVVGIASIFPFISAAADPSVVDRSEYLLRAKTYFEITDNRDFIVLLGGIVLFTLVLTNAFLAFSTWVTMRFVINLELNLSFRLLQSYLNESYSFHLKRNSAELLKNVTSEVSRVIMGIINAINVVSKGITAFFILGLLVLVDPVVAMFVGFVLGASYIFIYWSIRLKIRRIGALLIVLSSDRMRYINESLGGFKELTVLGRCHYYLKQFRDVSKEILQHQVFYRASVDLPRYLLETIAFGGILAVTIYLVAVKDNGQTVLPMISLYGFAGYRLMPALQGIFQSAAGLKHDIAVIDLFYDDIKGTSSLPFDINHEELIKEEPLQLNTSLVLDDICFHYPEVKKQAVSHLSLTIKANTSIGIVGSSGSGKSTLVDIILGLVQSQQGSLSIDGKKLTDDNLRNWQNNIGYVPQVIFLADSTISENIAFGVPVNKISQQAVEKAAKMANLHDFIISELEEGYQTIVGERGIRLSGGQRQRIGIARALYHNPSVLILDEATSALDTPTEQAVMEAVYNLTHKKTILMIAHRLTTIKECDKIIILEKGQVMDSGTYNDLSENSVYFKKLLLKKLET